MVRAYKQFLAFFFIFMLIFQNIPSQPVMAASLFPDVTTFRNEILFLNKAGIISGYNNGNFGPRDPVKRVQAVVMIMRELKLDTNNVSNPGFKDLKPGAFGYNEVAKATQLGIISGITKEKFDPNGVLTRAQMAKILTKAYDLKGINRYDFKDVRFDSWAYPYVHALAAHNITTGYGDGSFRPNETMNRMQFSAFMARYLNEAYKPMIANDLGYYTIEEMALNEQSMVTIEVYDDQNENISQGSGFIVANQLIATNFHVISGGVKAVAIAATGQRYDLQGVVAYDDYVDIALLKPVVRTGMPPLAMTSFDQVRKGQWVVALGSPLGFQNSISEGIVSGKPIFEDESGSVKAIQTSASITFGSSGGPLMNMNGEVIGINTFGLDTLNFAVASDYIINLLKPLYGTSFNDIKVQSFASMPEMEYPEEEGEIPNEGWQEEIVEGGTIVDETVPPTVDEELSGVKQTLGEIFVDAVHDPELPVIYGINENGELISVNYETKKITRLPFSYPAESIYFANGEILVTLLKGEHSSYWWDETQEGGVAIVDPTTLKVKKTFNVAIDPYDIVADDQYFYVSSGSGQWTYIKSYSRETGVEVSSAGIRQQSQIEMHSSKNRIYAVNSDSSPRDMEVFTINNGVISAGYDSPYHGDYPMEEWMYLSPDGKYVFNTSGTIFKATALKETNMQFAANLKTPFYSVAFSEDGTEFYLTTEDKFMVYDYETFLPIQSFQLSGVGYFLFNHKGSLVVLGEEMPANSQIVKTYILKADMTVGE
jgi:serine protease Do